MSMKYGELTNSDIIFEGTLKKSQPQKPKTFFNFITKRWRKRHFVLYKTNCPNQINLLYFKIDPSPESKYIGNINLLKLSDLSIDVGSKVNRSNVFSIQTSEDKGGNRVYFMSAQSLDLMNNWVENIVASLNLNSHNSRSSCVSTIPSSANHNYTRGISRMTQNYISTTKLNTAIWSTHTSPDTPRFSFSKVNERSSENTISSYYNLSPSTFPLFQDSSSDRILAEDEDIYKYPYENPSAHAYINLEDEETTSTIKKANSSGDIFFANSETIFNCSNEVKSMDIPSFQEYKFPVDDSMFEYRDLSTYGCETKGSSLSLKEEITEEETCGFNFPLPTRVKNVSTSSSSTSNTSSSFEEDSDKQSHEREIKCSKLHTVVDQSPPDVPKRSNIPKTIHLNNKAIVTETVLPSKGPRSLAHRNGSSDPYPGFAGDCLTTLNYLDAENLLLVNHGHMQVDLFSDIFPSHCSHHAHLSTELKYPDCSNGRHTPSHANIEDSTLVKDVVSMVEYREICDVRTEAVLKLNARIFNKE